MQCAADNTKLDFFDELHVIGIGIGIHGIFTVDASLIRANVEALICLISMLGRSTVSMKVVWESLIPNNLPQA